MSATVNVVWMRVHSRRAGYWSPKLNGCVSAQVPSGISLPDGSQISVLSIDQTARWPGLILQPDSSPVSESQLSTEIKAIYTALVIAEAKCNNLDTAQANNPSVELDKSQWQALIGLHRTLLYEHHDFLMATQHPSATPELKALPTTYSMPARMWKYGIHAFLEVLRHRRPSSQDYMLSFIYLAYQMMTLLYETAPIFLDTWIECLGDLARYRMSIEEEKEPHAQWGYVAASWYIKASDRHPQIGRLYHHLAILERPSLRKFACYGKSLTCVVPFTNARDSLRTLCEPIASEAQPARSVGLLSEASFCKLHALIFLAAPDAVLEQASYTAMSFLRQPDTFRWRDCGVPLAVANISALLGYGSDSNPLRLVCDVTIQRINERTRLGQSAPNHVATPPSIRSGPPEAKYEETRRLLQVSKRITLDSLHTVVRCPPDIAFMQDSLAFMGVMFCFIHFSARQGIWPEKAGEGKPLPEDFSIRGLVWAYFSFCPGWFDSDEDEDWLRNVEMASTHTARADRALYYGLRLAFETPYLSYDSTSCTFSTGSVLATSPNTQTLQPLRTNAADLSRHAQRALPGPNAPLSPPSSAPASSASDSDYVHVRRPAKQAPPAPAPATKTYATVVKTGGTPAKPARPTKPRLGADSVKVVDPESVPYEQAEA
ncbi:hypothetical protein B0A55_01927 [Friedmanniomyces simplex]|uniref:DNA/RNA-binding domain-containing protein n=1 Tax=Friedmanniomyces simplex TaxID=329884 RepID=A0A4U0XVY2_9PEZI|nr:hypothetical protein B0A55_01927 [Friedmanniomyces simplex]